MHTPHEVGAVEERIRRSADGLVGEEPYQVEETKYMISAQKVLFLTLFISGFECFLCTNHSN